MSASVPCRFICILLWKGEYSVRKSAHARNIFVDKETLCSKSTTTQSECELGFKRLLIQAGILMELGLEKDDAPC